MPSMRMPGAVAIRDVTFLAASHRGALSSQETCPGLHGSHQPAARGLAGAQLSWCSVGIPYVHVCVSGQFAVETRAELKSSCGARALYLQFAASNAVNFLGPGRGPEHDACGGTIVLVDANAARRQAPSWRKSCQCR